ncbi:hypothetical protein GCM10010277_79260 [Streptomyces longisporoflavus]|nr:hypothetical protein GCM10010277_79260 [Streptomyces longisporoflavus]
MPAGSDRSERPVGIAMTVPQPAAPGYAAQLPCRPESVNRARALVSKALDNWGLTEDLADIGEFIVSELLTNVVNHTSTDLTTVTVQRGGHCRVRIEVADTSHNAPCIKAASSSDECGRGLVLVDALSSHWGYVKHPWGKVTWAELSTGAVREW